MPIHFLLHVFWRIRSLLLGGQCGEPSKIKSFCIPSSSRFRNWCGVFKTLHRAYEIIISYILYSCCLLTKSCKGLGTMYWNCYQNWPIFWCLYWSEIWTLLWGIKYLVKDTQHLPFPLHCSIVLYFLPGDPSPTSLRTDTIFDSSLKDPECPFIFH